MQLELLTNFEPSTKHSTHSLALYITLPIHNSQMMVYHANFPAPGTFQSADWHHWCRSMTKTDKEWYFLSSIFRELSWLIHEYIWHFTVLVLFVVAIFFERTETKPIQSHSQAAAARVLNNPMHFNANVSFVFFDVKFLFFASADRQYFSIYFFFISSETSA